MSGEAASQYSWQTLHDLLGVALGASIEHIKESYRLLSRKNSVTDAAYYILIDPEERAKHGILKHRNRSSDAEEGKNWGKRGRERCSCGRLLEENDEWLCVECSDRQVYFVTFGMYGARIVHEDGLLWNSDNAEERASDTVIFGPFTSEEAKEFLAETTRKRDR